MQPRILMLNVHRKCSSCSGSRERQCGYPHMSLLVPVHWTGSASGGVDALHIASAEVGNVDAVITTDDRMIRVARRPREQLKVRVISPLEGLSLLSEEDRNEEGATD